MRPPKGFRKNDEMKAMEVLPILKEKVAYLSGEDFCFGFFRILIKVLVSFPSGGRDKRGGPILTFPARSNHDRIRQEDLRRLISYLACIPRFSEVNGLPLLQQPQEREMAGRDSSASVSGLGLQRLLPCCFRTERNMRGSKWDSIKPLLKILQESFPCCIHVALIIKPDNFWQKQRTNFGSSKFEFETNMVSLEGLTKVVDPSQLTPEFDGCLEYNHEEWIEIRVAFEDYISNATHMLSRLEELQDILAKKDLPQDLEAARSMIEEHSQLKKKVIKAPIEDLDLEGQKLLQRIQSSETFPKKNSGSGNADLQNLLPKVSAMLDRLHSTRQHLHQMWHVRKLKLDQCFQLRLFEQDAEKVKYGVLFNFMLPSPGEIVHVLLAILALIQGLTRGPLPAVCGSVLEQRLSEMLGVEEEKALKSNKALAAPLIEQSAPCRSSFGFGVGSSAHSSPFGHRETTGFGCQLEDYKSVQWMVGSKDVPADWYSYPGNQPVDYKNPVDYGIHWTPVRTAGLHAGGALKSWEHLLSHTGPNGFS
uniref:Uncharacterized protein n=1 Tax=Sphaerodactylus townsendi TaxID=933632 RepID=A0ACB8FCB4_9SAUR